MPLLKTLTAAALFSSCLALPSRPSRWHAIGHRDVAVEYDYVIIGGGTSGLTVADRLTKDSNTTVLVVEYGALVDSPRISAVQGGFQGMDAQYMYAIESVPQVHLKNRTAGVLAGKVVGGSSAVNAMMTVRGTAEDYDRWGSFFEQSGKRDIEREERKERKERKGWDWEGLLPYFRRALHFTPPLADVAASAGIVYNTSFWGNSSGVYTGWPSFQFPGTSQQVAAFRSMPGVEFPEDSGAGEPGVYWFPSFMEQQSATRSYARTGHHNTAANRSNYHLLTRTKVDHIAVDDIKRRAVATGVFFKGNATANSTATGQFVSARREVILAAGGIHSPQIMQLSGLGPRALLEAARIPVKVDLPGVGQNFQDHPMLQAAFTLTNYTASFSPTGADMFLNATFRAWSDAMWKTNRTGPNSLGIGNAAAWLPFPFISPRWADVAASLLHQNHTDYLPAGTHPTVAAGYAAQMRSYAAALQHNKTAFYNKVLSNSGGAGPMVLLHPTSRGTVNIDPADPYNLEPLVDYRAMSNPIDGAVMADMIRYTRKFFMENPENAKYAPVELSPGDYVNSEEDLVGYLSETISPSEYHAAGTCAMLPLELGGVVDEQLRVYGVDGLRVVDASIFPTLPGANTCQTVYAVAEKAADLIMSSVAR